MTRKKIMILVLINLLILGACSSNNEKDNSKSSKSSFKNDELVTNNATVKIKEIFIIKNKVSHKKEIAFKYEIKKMGGKQLVPNTFFLSNFNIEQNSKKLLTGFGVNTMAKYDTLVDNGQRAVKSGKTSESVISYELDGNHNVEIQASGNSRKVDLSNLETVNYPVKD